MPDTNYIRIKDEAGTSGTARAGAGLITLGKILLWVDLIPLMFTYNDIRSGSYLWVAWAVIEGLLGIAMIVIGSRKRAMGIAQSSQDVPPSSRAA
jgi:hypothetical protein